MSGGSNRGEDSASSSSGSDGDSDGDALSHVPLAERTQMLADGSHTQKSPRFQRLLHQTKRREPEHGGTDGTADCSSMRPPKRRNKNAPVEEPISRRSVSVIRDAVQRKGARHYDPRFLPVAGGEDRDEDAATRRCALSPPTAAACSTALRMHWPCLHRHGLPISAESPFLVMNVQEVVWLAA
jgi:hypothetical protein